MDSGIFLRKGLRMRYNMANERIRTLKVSISTIIATSVVLSGCGTNDNVPATANNYTDNNNYENETIDVTPAIVNTEETDVVYTGDEFEDLEFIPDYRDGYQNKYGYGSVGYFNSFMYSDLVAAGSAYSKPSIPDGDYTDYSHYGNYRYVIQDQWVYYTGVGNKSGIWKYHITDDTSSAIKISPDNVMGLIGVVGDWVYYYINTTVGDGSVRRVRTDGVETEILLTGNDHGSDNFYVAGNQLFYTGIEQISASSYGYSLKSMNVDTKEITTLVSNCDRFFFQYGYKDYLICQHEQGDDHCQMSILDFNGYDLVDYDLDGRLICLLSPQTDKFIFSAYVGLPTGIYELVVVDIMGEYQYDWSDYNWPFTNHSNTYAVYRDYQDGITVVYPDGTRNILNKDLASDFRDYQDGYIYYEADSHLCRIKPDGSGWEYCDWMFPDY